MENLTRPFFTVLHRSQDEILSIFSHLDPVLCTTVKKGFGEEVTYASYRRMIANMPSGKKTLPSVSVLETVYNMIWGHLQDHCRDQGLFVKGTN